METLRTIYRYWAGLVFLAVIVQIGAAGYGAFNVSDKTSDGGSIDEDQFEDGFGLHIGLGYLIFLATVVLLLLALGSRFRGRFLWQNVAAPILLIVQIVLAWSGEAAPIVGVLHPINAILIAGLTGTLAFQAWYRRWDAQAAATTARGSSATA